MRTYTEVCHALTEQKARHQLEANEIRMRHVAERTELLAEYEATKSDLSAFKASAANTTESKRQQIKRRQTIKAELIAFRNDLPDSDPSNLKGAYKIDFLDVSMTKDAWWRFFQQTNRTPPVKDLDDLTLDAFLALWPDNEQQA